MIFYEIIRNYSPIKSLNLRLIHFSVCSPLISPPPLSSCIFLKYYQQYIHASSNYYLHEFTHLNNNFHRPDWIIHGVCYQNIRHEIMNVDGQVISNKEIKHLLSERENNYIQRYIKLFALDLQGLCKPYLTWS